VRGRAPRRRGPGGGEGVEREADDGGAVGVPAAALAAARPGLPLLRYEGHLPAVQELQQQQEDLVAHRVHRYDGFSGPAAQGFGSSQYEALRRGWRGTHLRWPRTSLVASGARPRRRRPRDNS
jgi:hypothetical protein